MIDSLSISPTVAKLTRKKRAARWRSFAILTVALIVVPSMVANLIVAYWMTDPPNDRIEAEVQYMNLGLMIGLAVLFAYECSGIGLVRCKRTVYQLLLAVPVAFLEAAYLLSVHMVIRGHSVVFYAVVLAITGSIFAAIIFSPDERI